MTTDSELMCAVRDGNLDAFQQLVLKYEGTAVNVAYRFLGDAPAAQDIAQEAFLRILVASPRYQPTAGFHTYLCRVVTRLCIDHARRKTLDCRTAIGAEETAAPPGALVEAKETEQVIRQALNLLPDKYRMAVVLKYFEALKTEEVAEAMGVSAKAVERILYRARKQLEPLLRDWMDE